MFFQVNVYGFTAIVLEREAKFELQSFTFSVDKKDVFKVLFWLCSCVKMNKERKNTAI